MPFRFSPRAERFLRERISSTTQLDALILLHGNDARWWTATTLAAELRISQASAASALESLGRSNVVDVRVGASLAYRFAPVDREVSDAVDEIASAHYEHRDEILARVAARGSADAARRIADAFRIKQGKRDA